MNENKEELKELQRVLDFIKEHGYKYDYFIQEELDKISKISDKEIKDDIEKNHDLFKRMASLESEDNREKDLKMLEEIMEENEEALKTLANK